MSVNWQYSTEMFESVISVLVGDPTPIIDPNNIVNFLNILVRTAGVAFLATVEGGKE